MSKYLFKFDNIDIKTASIHTFRLSGVSIIGFEEVFFERQNREIKTIQFCYQSYKDFFKICYRFSYL